MAISILTSQINTAPVATACVGYPNTARYRFETSKATIAAAANLQLYFYFGQAFGASNFEPYLINPQNISGNLRFQAVQPLYWAYQVLGTENVSNVAFGGTPYEMTFAFPPNPALEGVLRIGKVLVRFFDTGGGGNLWVEIEIFWINQMDVCPPLHQFNGQSNRTKLLRHTYGATEDITLDAIQSFYRATKRFAAQLAAIEDFNAASTSQAAAQLYSTAAARWWNNQTPTSLLSNNVVFDSWTVTNVDGPTQVLNTFINTTFALRVTAGTLPTTYYVGIVRVDPQGEDQFYATQQWVQMRFWNGAASALNANYEITDVGIGGQANPTTVSGTLRQLLATIDGTTLQVNGTYRVFFLVEDAGAAGNWYPFISEPFTAVDCPPRAVPSVPVNELANYQATYGSNIIASSQQFIRSTIEVSGTGAYNTFRTIPLQNAVQAVILEGYYDETVGGVPYRQYVLRLTANRVNGVWPTNSSVVVTPTASGFQARAVFRIEAAPNLLNIATQDLNTGIFQAQRTGSQDWRGKTIVLRLAATLVQDGYQEVVEVFQKIEVPPNNDTAVLSLLYADTGLPVQQVCFDDPPIIACITEPDADDYEYQLTIAPIGQRPIVDLNSAPTHGILPQRTDPIFGTDWPTATTYGTACGTLDISRLQPGQDYQLCWVRRFPPVNNCYCLDFLGGADGSASEHVITTPSALLNFGTGPFAISAWFDTPAGPTDGGAIISRRLQVGTDETGWVLGPIGNGLQVVLSNQPGGGVTATFVNGVVSGWNHVVVNFGGLDASTWQIYLNGVLQPATPGWPQTIGPVTSFDPAEVTPPLALGIDTPINTEDYFNGRLANVLVVGQAVSAVQAADLYNDGLCGDPTALGLTNVVWYKLNELSGTTAPEPVNGITGTLTNYTPARTALGGGAWQPV